jgi:hypothetical protein
VACSSRSDLLLVRAALDRGLGDLDPHQPKAYNLDAIRATYPAAYPPGPARKRGGC